MTPSQSCRRLLQVRQLVAQARGGPGEPVRESAPIAGVTRKPAPEEPEEHRRLQEESPHHGPGGGAEDLVAHPVLDRRLDEAELDLRQVQRRRVDGADGFVYTVDWKGSPVVRERMHWVAAEATATAAALFAATGEPTYDDWYRTWWDHVADVFLDHDLGSWRHELDPGNRPTGVVWNGKPDAYHAFQATLFPRLPLAPTLATALRDGPAS